MTPSYRLFFELEKEPFSSDIPKDHILATDTVTGAQQRIHYAIRTGAVALVTGEIGSGKSTALRYVTESLHPSENLCLYVTATSGSILELYRQILGALGVDNRGVSRALMLQTIRSQVAELTGAKKLKVLLVIDEVSLLRMEVFAELHTLLQFEKDAKPFLPLVMAGQNNLIDSLHYRPAMPLASRVVARSHLGMAWEAWGTGQGRLGGRAKLTILNQTINIGIESLFGAYILHFAPPENNF